MSTKFSGGSYLNGSGGGYSILDGSTKTTICNGLETLLNSVGWTTVSGTGTTNVLLETAQDPTTTNRGRVRFKDNAGSCVQVTIENHSGSAAQPANVNTGGNLLPATSKQFRVLASKYRFECLTVSNGPREFVCAGIIWIPTPYQGIITEAIYMSASSQSDTDTSFRNCFRSCFAQAASANNADGGNCANITNGALMNWSGMGNSTASGGPTLRIPSAGLHSNWYNSSVPGERNCYRWHDLALDQADPLIGWANTDGFGEALLRGQVYDWTILSDSFAIDITDSWTDGGSSHNFYCMTSVVGTNNYLPRGSIWVAYS